MGKPGFFKPDNRENGRVSRGVGSSQEDGIYSVGTERRPMVTRVKQASDRAFEQLDMECCDARRHLFFHRRTVCSKSPPIP